jgi:hypothetical protein
MSYHILQSYKFIVVLFSYSSHNPIGYAVRYTNIIERRSYKFLEKFTLHNAVSTHSLALVKWYRLVQDHRTRYFCQVDNDIKSCNIEFMDK